MLSIASSMTMYLSLTQTDMVVEMPLIHYLYSIFVVMQWNTWQTEITKSSAIKTPILKPQTELVKSSLLTQTDIRLLPKVSTHS